ncbi:LOW QUALITY PROTEIN: hypothetical protein BT93_F1463 [Corymbia citriodora subsp. variegata]|nr:LOW QUALITY PROTEIN: hypothetical protein BT93_F1463 [Corymbia citriodora subsp. variegata]
MERDETRWKMPNGKRPHFFEIYSSSLSSRRLKIPDKFVKHMEGWTSGLALLEGPSGNTWHVELIQENREFFLNSGWHSFVRDHSIVSGDLLVFRHDGNLHFYVQVFEDSSCEKEAAFHAMCSQDPSSCRQNVVGKMGRGMVKKMSSPIVRTLFMRTMNLNAMCCRKQDAVTSAQHRGTSIVRETPYDSIGLSSKAQVYEDSPDIRNRFSKGDHSSLSTSCHMLKSLSEEERKVARSFSSRFPYFVRIMKRFNISGSYTLNIPYQFSMEHLPESKITIVLRNLKGESWTVNSVPTTRVHTSHTFCGGWMAFVRANGIELEDVCVFELVHKCEMRVHILGAAQGGPECQSVKKALTWLDVRNTTALHAGRESVSKKRKRKSTKVSSQIVEKVKRMLQEASSSDMKKHAGTIKSSSNASKTSNGKSAIIVGASTGTARTSQNTDCLSAMLSLQEERVARSFASSFPKFVRIMKRFNVSGSYTLKIPHQFSMDHLPICKTEIVLRNLEGESWTVNSVPDSKGRMLHTFCGGWLSFVRGNGIKIGDICIFELVGKLEMRVHISEDGKKEQAQQHGKVDGVLVPLAASRDN